MLKKFLGYIIKSNLCYANFTSKIASNHIRRSSDPKGVGVKSKRPRGRDERGRNGGFPHPKRRESKAGGARSNGIGDPRRQKIQIGMIAVGRRSICNKNAYTDSL